jgi:hypothetical protein
MFWPPASLGDSLRSVIPREGRSIGRPVPAVSAVWDGRRSVRCVFFRAIFIPWRDARTTIAMCRLFARGCCGASKKIFPFFDSKQSESVPRHGRDAPTPQAPPPIQAYPTALTGNRRLWKLHGRRVAPCSRGVGFCTVSALAAARFGSIATDVERSRWPTVGAHVGGGQGPKIDFCSSTDCHVKAG